MAIFKGVRFFCSPSFLPEERETLSNLFVQHGAESATLEEASHIVTNTPDFDGRHAAREDARIVTGQWVQKSVLHEKQMPPESYSIEVDMIFSGVVACASDLVPSDVEVLCAGITALGGQWRIGYTKEVTHLFVVHPDSEKYRTAMHYQHATNVKVVVPHWFDDSIRLGCRGLETKPYEWPDPLVLKAGKAREGLSGGSGPEMRASYKLSQEKASLFGNFLSTESQTTKSASLPEKNIWNKRRVLLSPDLELQEGRKQSVETNIRRCGGVVVDYEGDLDGVGLDSFDVLIARFRWGNLYLQAVRERKLVGTLTWMFHVQSTGAVTAPTDQLIHFPIPRKKLEGFDKHEITVTNYTGLSRDYLKKLIDLMGAKFTPSMSGKNTMLIAAYVSGIKTEKARNWNIPVVNHTWLEDCFIHWTHLNPAQEKYIHFPPNVDFALQLGERPLTMQFVLENAQDVEVEMAKEHQRFLIAAAQADDEENEDMREAQEVDNGMDVDEGAPPASNPIHKKTALPQTNGSVFPKAPKSPQHVRQQVNKRPTSKASPSRQAEVDEQEYQPSSRESDSALLSTTNDAEKDDDGDDEEIEINDDVDVEDVEDSPSRHTRSKQRGKRRDSESDEDEEELPRGRLRRKPASKSESKAKLKDKSPRRTRSMSAHRSRERNEDARNRSRTRTRLRSRTRSRKRRLGDEDDDEERSDRTESEDDGPAQAAKARRRSSTAATTPSKAKHVELTSKLTPHRTLSVLLPPVGTGPSLSQEHSTKRTKSPKGKGRARPVGDEEDTEGDDEDVFTRKQAATTPKSALKNLRKNSLVVDITTPSSVGRARRTAASKATQRLHDEIMPDVNNFQKELKRGSVRALAEKELEIEARSKAKEKAKGKAGTQSTSKRRRPSAMDTPEAGDEEQEASEPEPNTKKRRMSGKGKARAKSQATESEASGSEEIRLLTTGLQLADDVRKRLEKLGVVMVSDPKECTHVVINRIARTEKFLSALAVAPMVVDERWTRACTLQKRLVPADDDKYSVNDRHTEEKYGFNLQDALQRAKENNGELFKGMIFFVSPRVDVDRKLLKTIIIAHGGTLKSGMPSAKLLKEKVNNYLISCVQDRSSWQALSNAGITIYTTELILTSALVQEIRWNDPSLILSSRPRK